MNGEELIRGDTDHSVRVTCRGTGRRHTPPGAPGTETWSSSLPGQPECRLCLRLSPCHPDGTNAQISVLRCNATGFLSTRPLLDRPLLFQDSTFLWWIRKMQTFIDSYIHTCINKEGKNKTSSPLTNYCFWVLDTLSVSAYLFNFHRDPKNQDAFQAVLDERTQHPLQLVHPVSMDGNIC